MSLSLQGGGMEWGPTDLCPYQPQNLFTNYVLDLFLTQENEGRWPTSNYGPQTYWVGHLHIFYVHHRGTRDSHTWGPSCLRAELEPLSRSRKIDLQYRIAYYCPGLARPGQEKRIFAQSGLSVTQAGTLALVEQHQQLQGLSDTALFIVVTNITNFWSDWTVCLYDTMNSDIMKYNTVQFNTHCVNCPMVGPILS